MPSEHRTPDQVVNDLYLASLRRSIRFTLAVIVLCHVVNILGFVASLTLCLTTDDPLVLGILPGAGAATAVLLGISLHRDRYTGPSDIFDPARQRMLREATLFAIADLSSPHWWGMRLYHATALFSVFHVSTTLNPGLGPVPTVVYGVLLVSIAIVRVKTDNNTGRIAHFLTSNHPPTD